MDLRSIEEYRALLRTAEAERRAGAVPLQSMSTAKMQNTAAQRHAVVDKRDAARAADAPIVLDPLEALQLPRAAISTTTELVLSHRGATSLHPSFIFFSGLKYLVLQYNRLTEIRHLLPPVADSSAGQTYRRDSSGCTRLTQLYLSYNQLEDIAESDIPRLRSLEELHVAHNRLRGLERLLQGLQRLRCLTCLDLRDNPVCGEPHYRQRIISRMPQLQVLDRQIITPHERAAPAPRSSTAAATPLRGHDRAVAFGTHAGPLPQRISPQVRRLWEPSPCVNLLTARRNRHLAARAAAQRSAEEAAEQATASAATARGGFHALWVLSRPDMPLAATDSRAGASVRGARAQCAAAPFASESARDSRCPAGDADESAAALADAVRDQLPDDVRPNALAGCRVPLADDSFYRALTRQPAAPATCSAVAAPSARRLADLRVAVEAAARLALPPPPEGTGVMDSSSRATLLDAIRRTRAAVIPSPAASVASPTTTLSAPPQAIQARLTQLLGNLLLPEEVQALEAKFGAAEVLEAVRVEQQQLLLQLQQDTTASAAGRGSSDGGRGGSRGGIPTAKSGRSSSSRARQQSTAAAVAERRASDVTLLMTMTTPVMCTSPLLRSSLVTGSEVQSQPSLAAGGSGSSTSPRAAVIGGYSHSTFDLVLSQLREGSGAWGIPTESLARALRAAHGVGSTAPTSAAASMMSVPGSAAQPALPAIDEAAAAPTRAASGRRELKRKKSDWRRAARETKSARVSADESKPSSSSSATTYALSLNNILPALACYVPFVKARAKFFERQCEAAVASPAQTSESVTALQWFHRAQHVAAHLKHCSLYRGSGGAEPTALLIPFRALGEYNVCTVGTHFRGGKHNM